MNIQDEILNNIVTDIQGLNLTLNGTALTVVKRKAMKEELTLDAVNQVTVAESQQADTPEYLAFLTDSTRHHIEIYIVSTSTDYLSNVETYALWREQIRKLYRPPLLFSTALWNTKVAQPDSPTDYVWDVRVKPGKFEDRSAIIEGNFDLQLWNLEVGVTQ